MMMVLMTMMMMMMVILVMMMLMLMMMIMIMIMLVMMMGLSDNILCDEISVALSELHVPTLYECYRERFAIKNDIQNNLIF